jgi:sulfur carrier protein
MIVRVNGQPREIAAGATVAALVESLEVETPRRGIAVAVDAEVVPRGEWPARELEDGARVEVLTAVQGG